MKNMSAKITLFLLLLATGVFAQAPPALQADTKKLYSAFDDIDIDKLSAMIFSPLQPSEVYEKLDAYFLNDEQKFRYVYTNVKYNFGPVQTIDDKSYCMVTFRNVIRITYFKKIDVASVQADLKIKFNSTSINYEPARNSFLIVYNARMLAAQTGGVWQFAFLDHTIPDDISEGALTETIKKSLGL